MARAKPPLEHSLLYTATLCLFAAGAVMVYSASSAESLLGPQGDPSYFLKRYLLFGALGLVALHFLSRHGLALVRRATGPLLAVSFGLTVAVMVPGIGVSVNGATRWIGAGPLQFQPSEILKVALVLWTAQMLASRPNCVKSVGTLFRPLLTVVAVACALLMAQPDMGTSMVICFALAALLIAAGTPLRILLRLGGGLAALALVLAIAEPYRRERLTAFLDPWSDAGDTGFQAVQAMIAIGSGGLFGVGLGESVQKIFYLPEAHTDMILAIIGEELGLVGIAGLVALYGIIGYAGLRTAKAARDRHAKLLAAGITSLILCQAVLNFFAVMGMAPLTGVPLPLISYGGTNMIVLLGAMGILLDIASGRGKTRLRALDGGRDAKDRDRGRRDGGARRARAGHSRRAAG